MAEGEVTEEERLITDYAQRSLDSERARYDRLETRAGTIVTTTGGLVTVIGVITAFIPENQRSAALSLPSLIMLVLSLLLFLGAVTLAQGTNLSVGRMAGPVVPEPGGGLALAERMGAARERGGVFPLVQVDLELMAGYRQAARRKAMFLNLATLSQMFGVMTLTAAVIIALIGLAS